MRVTVVGVGNIGGTLAERLAAAGHQVTLANSRTAESLRDLAARIGARAASLAEACRDAEVVIVSVPTESVPTVADAIRETLPASTVLVDTSNYVPVFRDRIIPELEDGLVESEWVASLFGRPVIKAFNNINYKSLQRRNSGPGTPGRVALPVAGNDPHAKKLVMGLVNEVGFDAIDGGGATDSWRQQPGTPVYTTDLDAQHGAAAIMQAHPAQTRTWRQHMVKRASV